MGEYDADEIIALRAKMYFIRMYNTKDDKQRAKGVPDKAVILNEEDKNNQEKIKKGKGLGYEDYMTALGGTGFDRVSFNVFARAKDYVIYAKPVEKIALTAGDDKSHYFDEVRSLRYGHRKIKEIEMQRLGEFVRILHEDSPPPNFSDMEMDEEQEAQLLAEMGEDDLADLAIRHADFDQLDETQQLRALEVEQEYHECHW